eukprot:2530507-Pleurochrysis_carterae.AAC.2
MAAIERNAEEALLEMGAEHDSATARANAELQQLINELAAVKAESRKVEGLAGSAEQFAALSEGAQRTARSRDVAFALSFLEQRRIEDWIAALKKKGWLQDIQKSNEVLSLRREWARTLFSKCMSTHWGSRLGYYTWR